MQQTKTPKKKTKEVIRIFALGGQDEDGKNMMCVEIDGDIYIIEAGIKFPDPKESLGIEFIIQDLTYLIEHKDKVAGIFITHGHDDVMSALPYLLEHIHTTVYTSALCAKEIHRKLRAHKIKGSRIRAIKRHDQKTIANRKCVFFPVTHAYPGTFGVGILSKQGYIVYTGEFIEDYENLSELYRGDFRTLTQLEQKGIFVLLQESKGADRSGHTAPNHRLYPRVHAVLEKYPDNRVIIGVYTQSVYRIQEIVEACIKYNRKMYFFNKDIQGMLRDMKELGYEINRRWIATEKEFKTKKNIAVIISKQGPSLFRTLNNIANNEDDKIQISSDDVICIAAPVVPGAEKDFGAMENDIYKAGGKLENLVSGMISMHPSIEDLKMMLFLLRPKYYIPVKGEYRLLHANAQVALDMGYNANHILILDNGQVATFSDGKLRSCHQEMELSDTLIDGKENWDMAGVVLKDRDTLSTDGVMILAIGLDAKTKKIINGPDVQSRGLIYLKDAEYITADVAKIMEETITKAVQDKKYDNMNTRNDIRDKVIKYLIKKTAKRPMVLPVIMEINR
ncbi:MAG: ribonuclease J [Erysipelotrichaceae bacterium]|nr:ribonuclease J [Erysipelotrichaceae bacterium]